MSYFTQIKILGNIGAVMDAPLGTVKPANALQVGGNDGTNLYALPLSLGGGSLLVTVSSGVPSLIQQDDRQYDDDGFPYVNPNVPGADIATGDKQTQEILLLQQIAAKTSTTITGGVVAVTQSTIPWAENVSQWAGSFLGSPSVYGTSPGAVNVPGVNAFITNTPAVTVLSGTIAVTQSTSPWVTSISGTPSFNLTQVAGVSLGNLAVVTFGGVVNASSNVVPAVNANIYSAGAAITSSAPLAVQLSQGGSVLTTANPIFSAITDGTTKVGVIAGITSLRTDLSSVAGTATVTAAAGVLRVGIAGNSNATLDVAQGGGAAATNALQIAGVFNTTQPTLTTGQGGAVALTSRAAQIVATGVDAFNIGTDGVNVHQLLTDTSGREIVIGAAASGASKAGNPVQVGAVFNTTQPTVTTGQVVESQATARGALIVAPGVDGFNVGGLAAADAAQSGNPVLVAGVDGSGNVQELPVADTGTTAPSQTLVTGGVYNTTVPSPTAGQAVQKQSDSTGSLYVNAEGRKATYRATAVKFTPLTSVTAPTWSMNGSASKVVRVTQIRFSLYDVTGATTPATVSLQRFSALTGGTAVGLVSAKNDTNDPNSSGGNVVTYTVLPTPTAAAGTTDAFDYQLTTVSATTAPAPPPYYILFGSQPGAKELVLRGSSDFLGIIINGVGTTPVCSIMVEWTEE